MTKAANLLQQPIPPLPLIATVVSALLTWLLLWMLIPWLRRRLLDQPNARSSHRIPTPRGGGVVFVLVGSLLSLALGAGTSSWIPLICCPLALVGLLDDRFDLPAVWRYAAQVATAGVLVAMAAVPLPIWALPLVLVAITAVINFTNFMDGLDGLVALCGIVLMASVGLWPVAGALLGFLAWNWSPAKVFMGDVGSTWIGAVFAGMVLQQPGPWEAISLLLVSFPLLGDALICVLRRLRAGQPVFQAHRLHLFQRLQRGGWPHAKVAFLYGGATTLLALARPLGGAATLIPLIGAEMLIALWMERNRAVSFQDEAKTG
jgi:UDP-N-acetylmuramyl pentapeptide phosphotransferase/UDP-N-acetylglucosamine-1-phosphate transferase